MKKSISLTLLCALCMWLLAGLWHKVIMVQFYRQETGAEHEGTLVIFIAYLVLSSIMVYLYRSYSMDDKSIKRGFIFGAVMGVLWVFPHELAMAGAHRESLSYVFINGIWHVFEQGAGGIVLAWLSSRISQRQS